MALIEDYALIGDLQTAALVGRDGSIDWCCFPRFDSGACFAALLGDDENGRWRIAPVGAQVSSTWRYRSGTLVLETDWETETGAVRVIDFMPPRGYAPDIVRIVEGLHGHVDIRAELAIRFDYGSVVPWVRQVDDALLAIAGPDLLCLRTPAETHGEDLRTVSEFRISQGERVPFALTWHPSHEGLPDRIDPEQALRDADEFWNDWSGRCTYEGEWSEHVIRSLIVLKALTYAPTGGIVAAPTTSLPEFIGGERNWDYRYCWLRDTTLTLLAFLSSGYTEEAAAWRSWLLRAVAGNPGQAQVLYGLGGERRLGEIELPWLAGYEGSKPVRVGNGACEQLQIDVFGEVMDALHQSRLHKLETEAEAWTLQTLLVATLAERWREPDHGIWEVRGDKQHFTHSKVMAWVAFDRAVRAVEEFGRDGPVDEWRRLRDEIHAEVCAKAWNEDVGAFTQYYGSEGLDASVLMIPLVGFLPADDDRMIRTVDAIQRTLEVGGLIARYETTDDGVDGLPAGEGVFLPCSFWLADNLAMQGRRDEARELFERLLGLCNDLGLLAEEYDTENGRLVGNFPQAFTHIALINTAYNLSDGGMRRDTTTS